MRNYIIYIFLLLSFTACNDKLTLAPAVSLPTEDALTSIAGVKAGISGMYAGMRSVNYYGRNFLVIPEIAADNVYLSATNSNRFGSSFRITWLTADADITNFWNQAYTVILRANNIINNVPLLKDGTEKEKNDALGQALFVRALVHFDLLRTFSQPYAIAGGSAMGIPYMTKFEVGSPARNTQDEVYTQLIKDLTQAKSLLAKDAANPYNANAYAASALLARVYLYKGDNANAVTEASTVISAGSYTIVAAADLPDFYNVSGTKEEIFTLKVLAVETLGSDDVGKIYLKPGYGDIRVSPDLVKLFDTNDARYQSFIKPFTGSAKEYENEKYYGQDGIFGLYSPKILRISEQYLIRAEANAKLGNYAVALQDLNAIRANRTQANLVNIPDADVLANVLLERRKEMMFEGHRYFDLLRNKLDIVRNFCGDPLELNTPSCTYAATSPTVIPPIPQREIDVNKSIVQNKGY
ncbi:RagB/SusD family nutrient uptake outer membrane protein [Chitinophaga sancti]|uniref:RagB/SusD family nutrient uptake outer membrane protein n=1 Tax=Chitinophaga sancti TaxID=1004 RepID=UPI003F795CFF